MAILKINDYIVIIVSFFYLLFSSCGNDISYKIIPTDNILVTEIEPESRVKIISKLKGKKKCTIDSIAVSTYFVILKSSGDTMLVLTPCDDLSINIGENRVFYPETIVNKNIYIPYEKDNEYSSSFKASIGKLLLPDD